MTGCLSAQAPPFSAGLAVLSDGSSLLFNDAIRACQQAHPVGVKISDAEVQRQVKVAVQHRKVHEARIEGRRIAAGLAEIANACGTDVGPGPIPAASDEAGAYRGAA